MGGWVSTTTSGSFSFQRAVGRALFDGWAEDTTFPESSSVIRSPPGGRMAIGSWCGVCTFCLFVAFFITLRYFPSTLFTVRGGCRFRCYTGGGFVSLLY